MVCKIFMFLKEVSSAQQGCIYLIKNTVKTVILLNILTISKNCFLFEYIVKCNLFLWWKAEFSASLLQSSVSHDPSEIILICGFATQKKKKKSHYYDQSYVDNSCAARCFCGNRNLFFWWIESSKEQHLFEIQVLLHYKCLYCHTLINLTHPYWMKVLNCTYSTFCTDTDEGQAGSGLTLSVSLTHTPVALNYR